MSGCDRPVTAEQTRGTSWPYIFCDDHAAEYIATLNVAVRDPKHFELRDTADRNVTEPCRTSGSNPCGGRVVSRWSMHFVDGVVTEVQGG